MRTHRQKVTRGHSEKAVIRKRRREASEETKLDDILSLEPREDKLKLSSL